MSKTIEVPRDLLALYLSGDGGDWVEAGHELRALLAAPAVERQSTVWDYCPECGCEELHYEQGEHKQCANCYQEWYSSINYSEVVRSNLARLRASPPAPVAVVLPERKDTVQMDGYQSPWDAGWNACLDKIKELNQ